MTPPLLLAAVLAAQAPAPAASPATVEALRACRAIAEDSARLACLDRAADALIGAVDQKQVAVVPRADITEARRSLFGFSLPRVNLFGGSGGGVDEQAEVKELNLAIRSARPLGYRKWRLVLDTGAVWETTEAVDEGVLPRPGSKIRIRSGALGSYMLSIDGEKGVRGKRVE